jgi:hypothetical protein
MGKCLVFPFIYITFVEMNNMKKEIFATVTIFVFFLVCILYLAFNYKPTPYKLVRVKIESVKAKRRYENLPDIDYTYHTNIGDFTTTSERFTVGDSITLKVIEIKN